MNNIATTIEQSKKLLELGLSPESADMYYLRIVGETYDKYGELISLENNLCKVEIDSPNRLDYPEDDILPCWSVGALLNIIPKDINGMLVFGTIDNKKGYAITLNNLDLDFEAISTSCMEVMFDFIVWLLENNYIKKEGNT